MKLSIECECGNKDHIQSKEGSYISTNLYSEKFNISGHDDGGAYIDCQKCGKSLNF